eukprot:gene8178-9710_t
MWSLPVCFGLQRVLAQHIETHGRVLRDKVVDARLGSETRSKAMRHLSCLPHMMLPDLAQLMSNSLVAPDAGGEGGEADGGKLPQSVLQSLLKGAMRCDEPLVGFRYLLSPEVLEHTSIAVVMQVLHKAVKLVREEEIVKFAGGVLKVKSKTIQKDGAEAYVAASLTADWRGDQSVGSISCTVGQSSVTVSKSLLRLLSHGGDEGMHVMLHYWGRKELHRDIRIVILQTGLELLSVPGLATKAFGNQELAPAREETQVFEDAAKRPELGAVVQATLLQAVPKSRTAVQTISDPLQGFDSELLVRDKMASKLVPTEHVRQYFEKVVLRLCSAEVDIELRSVATTYLSKWVLAEDPGSTDYILMSAVNKLADWLQDLQHTDWADLDNKDTCRRNSELNERLVSHLLQFVANASTESIMTAALKVTPQNASTTPTAFTAHVAQLSSVQQLRCVPAVNTRLSTMIVLLQSK